MTAAAEAGQRNARLRVVDPIVDLVVALALTVAILGPALVRRGYVLRGDMVFVPQQPWKGAWLGLDGGVPRSVPMDAVVWALGQVLAGDLVQKLLLAGSLLALALGVARVLRDLGAPARTAGMVLACWNPYVAERLGIGQWACVAGYAVLPWLLVAARGWRDRRRGSAPAGFVLLALAGVCAPSMGLVAGLLCLAVVLTGRSWRTVAEALAAVVVANLPWAVPSVLGPGIRPPAGQFAGFAATAESGAGTLASVVSLGGIWKTSIVPVERTHAAVVLLSATVAVLALVALARRARQVPEFAGLLGAGAVVLVLAWVSGWAPVERALGDLAHALPALGILRDATRYLAPLALAVALGFALAVEALLGWLRERGGAALPAGITLALVPVAVLPTLAWGLHGFLAPSSYPASWRAAAEALDRAGGGGATVVLPWRGAYRGFAWTGGHAVLDPAPRFFGGEVLVDDRLYLDGRGLAGEDPYLGEIARGLDRPGASAALRRLGVRFVLVERGPGLGSGKTPGGRPLWHSRDLILTDLGGPVGPGRQGPPAAPVVVTDLLVGALMIAMSCRIRRTSG